MIEQRRLLLLLFLFIAKSAIGQMDLSFENYSTNDGLSESTVNAIVQDKNGIIWIGTNNGLNSYNGYDFTVYRNDPDDPNTISHNQIHSLAADTNGILWVGTANSFDRLNPNTKTFEHHYLKKDAESNEYSITQSPTETRIDKIYMDSEGIIWIGLGDNFYLMRFDPHTYSLETVDLSKYGAESRVRFICFFEDSKQNIWAGTDQKGAFRFNKEKESIRNFQYNESDPNSLAGNYIFGITEDAGGVLWFSTYGGGICRLNDDDRTFWNINADSDPQRRLNNNLTTDIKEIHNGELLVGTDGGGLNIVSADRQSIRYEVNESTNLSSLSNNVVRCIFQDGQNFIWTGHHAGGINISKDFTRKEFHKLLYNEADENALSNGNVAAIIYHSSGTSWVGTDGGGINVFSGKTKLASISSQEGATTTIDADVFLSLFEDKDGNVWGGTYLKGLYVFSPDYKVLAHYLFDQGDPEKGLYNDIRQITQDEEGYIWATSYSGGVYKIDPMTGAYKQFLRQEAGLEASNSLISNLSLDIICDMDNHIWVSSSEGLSKFEYGSDNITRYFEDGMYDDVVVEKWINCLFSDKNKNLWIGSLKGLYCFKTYNNQFQFVKHYTGKDGLPNEEINSIEQDADGHLWISTKNGLTKFDPEKEEFRNYSSSDGLVSNDFIRMSSAKAPNGALYFGSVNGLNWFEPAKIVDDTTRPLVSLTGFKIFNQDVPIGKKFNGRTILEKDISQTDELRLRYSDKVLTFEFVAIHYLAPEKNRIRYKLHGFDKDWHEVGSDIRFATYTNLSAGRYTFQVIGSNNDGYWNEIGKSIDIRIKPPFWRRWWFILIIVAGVGYLIYLYMQEREKSLKEEKEKLEGRIADSLNKVKEQEKQVQLKDQELKDRIESQREQNWYNEGMVKYNELLSSNKESLEELAKSILNFLVSYLDISQGAFYNLNDDKEDDTYLELISGYALDSEKLKTTRIEIGEGQVGAAFEKRQLIKLDNLPSNYSKFGSGLGEVSVQHLLIVPLMMNEDVVGVLELASIHSVEEYKVDFVQKIGESLTSTFVAIKANKKTAQLLEKSSQQAEELLAHEEELRQNLEEMTATQEEARRREEQVAQDFKKKEEAYLEEIEKLKAQLDDPKSRKREN